MVRAPYFDKNGMKKGAWSEEEDDKLKTYMEKNGKGNWRQLPKLAGLSRCGKSCRLRWVNYLRPNVKRGNYTSEEEDLIINLYREYGSRWSMIAAKLPGRSDNEIKNHWHTHLRKRASISYSTNDNVENVESKKEKGVINFCHLNEKDEASILLAVLCSKSSSESTNKQPYSSSSSSSSSGSYHVASNSNSSLVSNDECFEDFWTKPFLADTSSNMSDEYSTLSRDLVSKCFSSSHDHDTVMVDAYLWSLMEF